RREGFGWSAVFLVTTLLCTAVVVVFLIVDRRSKARARARTAAVTTAIQQPVGGAAVPIVPGPPVDTAGGIGAAAAEPQFQEVMTQIHRFGGEESPELAALVNAEASASYQTASQQCTSANCENQRMARELFTPLKAPIARGARRSSGAAP